MLLSPSIVSPSLFRPVPAAGGGGSDPDFANVVILTGFNGDFTDDSNSNHTPTVGPGSISTGLTNAKFSGNQVAQCGGGDNIFNQVYWTYPSSTDFVLEMNADWTIELFAWVDPNSLWQDHYAVLCWFDAAGSIDIVNQTGFGFFRNRAGLSDTFIFRNIRGTVIKQAVAGIGPFTDSTWHHLAAVNDGATNTVEVFFDGVTQGTNAGDTTALGITPMFSGARANDPSPGISAQHRPLDHKGHLEEVRVTKGVKRYTSNFTPPSAPFPRS